ncbi:MAG TPA: protein translocase component YidC [Clostridiales bacterium]|nr:protein translocase component YidC [Clostridiales bacterium]
MGIFAGPIGSLLAYIYGFVNNYGLSIILLTVIVRICMLPLYSKQIKSSAAMAEIQPKLKEIQARYANDKETMNKKLQELYAKEKFNPMSGCLPLLVQMPIIMGLFSLLRNPLEYMSQPEMVVAVHEAFLWVPDLSQPDNWILPIAAGLSTFFTYSQTMGSTPSDANNMMSGMKYFFPIMIFMMGRTFPSGLALYWAVGNGLMIVQTYFLNKQKAKQRLRVEVEQTLKKKK